LVDFQYAYLLGLYLGDGCLLRHRRGVYRLHITLDAAHPVIAAECQAAMSLVMPASRIRHPKKTYAYPRYFFTTARSISSGSSAGPATGWESPGDRTARGTSRWPAVTRSRSSTATSGAKR
jgi:hypothetical protein